MKDIRKLVLLCAVLCLIVLYGCGSEGNIEISEDLGKDAQSEVQATITEKPQNAEVKTEPKATATVTPTVTPTPTEAVEEWEPISCRIEGNAIVFSGKGELNYRIVETLLGELEETLTPKEIRELENVDTVVIEEGITKIGMQTFDGYSGLKHVEIPQSVKVISAFAFEGTEWLEEKRKENPLVIVNGILIDARTVSGIVEIPSDVVYTTKWAFEEGWIEKQREQNGLVIINGILLDGTTVNGDVIIPEGVRYIADGAFENCEGITSVSIPDGVESIGVGAFNRCSNLVDVGISDSVKSIGDYAFFGCVNLSAIEIPDEVSEIGNATFYYCTSLKSIKLPETIRYVGKSAFEECALLIDIELPQNIKVIEDGAFVGCESLTEMTLPEGVTTLGEYAFAGCKNLVSIKLPEGITKLEEGVFKDCDSLTNIDGLENVTSIAGEVFVGTQWLENQKQSNEWVIVNETLIAATTTKDKITVPEGIKVIAGNAFEEGQVREVELPSGIVSIGNKAFKNCSNLEKIIWPESVATIGWWAFKGCNKLRSIAIPKTVEWIEVNAFEECNNLTIYCDQGSFAEVYAKEIGISYVTVEDDFWINGAVMPTELPSIKELIEKGNGKITIDGNEYYAVWGETGAFIWRYVEATFDSLAHYVSTFIVDENPLENMCLFEGNIYRTEFRKYDADEWQWYLGDYVQKEVRVTHIGEDMFEIQESNSGAWSIEEWKNKVILNGPDDYMFSLDTIGLPDFRIWDSDYFYLRSMHRQNQYSDDYVCMKIEYYDPWYYLKGRYEYVYIWLDKYGNYQYVNLEKYIWDEDTGIGSYSDGVFYCDGRFFDFYLNVILDIQEQGYEPYVGTDYSPKFVDGICTMIAKKNGKYWMFDIDKSGNIISDIEEVDI